MSVPIIPASAPFSTEQRAWLNGFFAGLLGFDGNASPGATSKNEAVINMALGASQSADSTTPAAVEDFPWHDPNLSLDERMQLAQGKPVERQLMAAMAQLDCGTCGYLCQTYAEAIARGEDKQLSKCTPGGKETLKKLKELVANCPPEDASSTQSNDRHCNRHTWNETLPLRTMPLQATRPPQASPLNRGHHWRLTTDSIRSRRAFWKSRR
jgi:sulfite reductase (NADPH) flavoprotein alpha-component